VGLVKVNWAKFSLIGLAGGFIGGMFGVGGGIIMVPLLTWAGFTQKQAQGTSLSATVPLALISATIYAAAGSVNLHSAIPLALGGVIGAYIGTALVRRFSNRLLYQLFNIMLLLIAIRHATSVLGIIRFMQPGTTIAILAFPAGILAGFVSGFFGVGGGVVFVPTGVQFLGLGEKVAQGSSFLAIIPTALLGFFRYHSSGYTRVPVIAPIIIGAVMGSIISSVIAIDINDKPLALAFSVFLALVAIRRIFVSNQAR
jgi:hypothetical protein